MRNEEKRIVKMLRCECQDGADCRECEAVDLCHSRDKTDAHIADLIERLAYERDDLQAKLIARRK